MFGGEEKGDVQELGWLGWRKGEGVGLRWLDFEMRSDLMCTIDGWTISGVSAGSLLRPDAKVCMLHAVVVVDLPSREFKRGQRVTQGPAGPERREAIHGRAEASGQSSSSSSSSTK